LEWLRLWSELDAAQQERLGEAVGVLLDRGFVLKGPATSPDVCFRMLDHHEAAARAYLRVIGWDLRIDRVGGFVQAVHPEGHGRVRLGKNASLLLCVLRLLYQQKAGATAWETEILVSVSDIQEAYLIHSGADRPFARQFLATTLRRFQQLSLIALPRPFDPDPDVMLELLPTLKAALPDSALERVSARMEDYLKPAKAGALEGEEHS
jgi:hypothetical protein